MHILVFDSGIGGVGIAQALRELLPQASLTYLIDDAGFPYGDRDEADLNARIPLVIDAATAACAPDLVVVACNTASTTALAALRARYALPFIGCVPPVKSAAASSVTKTIGVLATPATVRGTYLRQLAQTYAADCRVLIHGAPGLARLAERRFAGAAVSTSEIAHELAGLLSQPGSDAIDEVALGCTHYALLLPELRACLPANVGWHDPAWPVARQAQRVAATLPATQASSRHDGLVLSTGGVDVAGVQGWAQAGFHRSERIAPAGLVTCAKLLA
jgi:glutamate racemase